MQRHNSVTDTCEAVSVALPTISNVCHNQKGYSAASYGYRFLTTMSCVPTQSNKKSSCLRSLKYSTANAYNWKTVEQINLYIGEIVLTFKLKSDAYSLFSSCSSRFLSY